MNVFGFNTTRLYGEKGQRISVGWEYDLLNRKILVLFNDHDRGISGRLKQEDEIGFYDEWHKHVIEDDDSIHHVKMMMNLYDHNMYEFSTEADKVRADSWPDVRM